MRQNLAIQKVFAFCDSGETAFAIFAMLLFVMGVRGELATDYNSIILFSPFPEWMNLFEPGRVVGAKDAIESKKP